jgi:hypothetical protein
MYMKSMADIDSAFANLLMTINLGMLPVQISRSFSRKKRQVMYYAIVWDVLQH